MQSGETPLMLAAKDCETEVVAALEDALKIEEMRKEAGASALFFPPHTQTPPSRSGGRCMHGRDVCLCGCRLAAVARRTAGVCEHPGVGWE